MTILPASRLVPRVRASGDLILTRSPLIVLGNSTVINALQFILSALRALHALPPSWSNVRHALGHRYPTRAVFQDGKCQTVPRCPVECRPKPFGGDVHTLGLLSWNL